MLVLGAIIAPSAAATTPRREASARERAHARKHLLHALKRDPRVASRTWFLREAGLFGVDLPVTFRLNPTTGQAGVVSTPDDSIRLTLGSSETFAPLPAGFTVATATSMLTGTIQGSLRFSQDSSGYGGLGVVELGFETIRLSGTGFDLIDAADPSPCGGDHTLLKATDPVLIGANLKSPSRGYVDLVHQQFSIDLHTAFSFASAIRPDCSLDGNGDPPPFTATSTTRPVNTNPPLPLRLDGAFRISPALTADGHVRLGRLEIAGAQHASFAQLRSCTQAPPPVLGCALGTDGVLPSRLIATAFTADMLVGSFTS